ncbi:HEAT repeat-containing protein 6 [Homalodisca vitripennis]|nr:HEAT repeat-containing protein 6 [Homalodisca vitripennis]KAG8337307.1 HEAT repeat-containing protein 6 [Homalodisca vitripennis]
MEKKSLDYYAFQFNTINNDNRKEDSRLNNLLDQLNAFDCKLFSSPENSKKIAVILSQCFSLVPPDDTFLVAKCCQLMLTLVGKQAVQLEKPLLNIAIPWSLHALQQSADIAFLDILQALEAIICSSISSLEEKYILSMDRATPCYQPIHHMTLEQATVSLAEAILI